MPNGGGRRRVLSALVTPGCSTARGSGYPLGLLPVRLKTCCSSELRSLLDVLDNRINPAFGLERRALKVGTEHVDYEHLVLRFGL